MATPMSPAATPTNTLSMPAKPVGTAPAWLADIVDVSDTAGLVVVPTMVVLVLVAVGEVDVGGTDVGGTDTEDDGGTTVSEGGCVGTVLDGKVNEPLVLGCRLN